MALIINESNGNIDNFALSTFTVRREGIAVVQKNADDIRKKFKESLAAKDLTLHFDGKAVKEFAGVTHLEQERIAVIVSSPTLADPQVLGIPPAESSKGTDQQKVLIELIEEWGLKDYHYSITTAAAIYYLQ